MRHRKLRRKDLREAYDRLVELARPDLDFIFLTASAAGICALGFRMNSPAVIVGAMVVSPLLYSIVSMGVATFWRDRRSFARGTIALVVGLSIAVGVAAAIGAVYAPEYRSEIAERIHTARQDYFFAAIFSGAAEPSLISGRGSSRRSPASPFPSP